MRILTTGTLIIAHLLCLTIAQDQDDRVVFPDHITTFELGQVNVTCSVAQLDDGQTASYRFKRNGSDEYLPATPGESPQQFFIDRVLTKDAGLYWCEVTVTGEDSWSGARSTQVNVEYRARWDPYAPTKFGAKLERSAQLICKFRANPVPDITWTYVGGSSPREIYRDVITTNSGHHVTSTHSIKFVTEEDYGSYTCEATSSAGSNTFQLRLEPPGQPDGPIRCFVLNVTANEVQLMCVPGFDGGEKVSYIVEQEGLRVVPGVAKSNFTELRNGSVHIEVQQLYPNISYTLKVFVSNRFGKSAESFGVFVTTEDGAAPVFPPAADDDMNLPLLIGVSVGGVVVLLILIVLVAACIRCCAKSSCTKSCCPCCYKEKRTTQSKPPKNAPELDENYTNSLRRRDQFRYDVPRPASAMSQEGIEAGFMQQPGGTVQRRGRQQHHIQLEGFDPGESDDGPLNSRGFPRQRGSAHAHMHETALNEPNVHSSNTLQLPSRATPTQPGQDSGANRWPGHSRSPSQRSGFEDESPFGFPNPAYMPDAQSVHSGRSSRPTSLMHALPPGPPPISRAQIPLPAIPYQDAAYRDVPFSPVVGQGALSGVGVFTSLPILEPLTDQFRRASMRRKSSKRYRADRPPAPRMGLRVTPPKPSPAGSIPPLDGSPPDGWARPYPSPEHMLNPNQNPFFSRDNQAFAGSPHDPESQGQRRGHPEPGQGQGHASSPDAVDGRHHQSNRRGLDLATPPEGQVHAGHRQGQPIHQQGHSGHRRGQEEPPLRRSHPPPYSTSDRPPSYNLMEFPDGGGGPHPPGHASRPVSGQMGRPPSGQRSRPPSGLPPGPGDREPPREWGPPPPGAGMGNPPAQPSRPPPSRPLHLPLREALPDVTPTPPLHRQISGPQPSPTDLLGPLSQDEPYNIPDSVWEFPRDRLYIRQRIGEGLMGEVWRARADGVLGRPGQMVVAVKTLRDDHTPEERQALLRELRVMKGLQPHPNVVSLLGCCTNTDPPYIIMEYAGRGNLQLLLRAYRLRWTKDPESMSPYANAPPVKKLTSRDLVIFALEVARGMEYVSSQELLHRDLAARNILVDENYVCKVADFGSARDVVQSRQYETKTRCRLPIRWMAPEALLDCMYSTKSDVWAFGVLLWEIVTLGSSPYPGMNGSDVMELIQSGYRMEKPKLCSDDIYMLMRECWQPDPEKRPTFNELRDKLESQLKRSDAEVYTDQMSENMYEILEDLPGEKC